MLKIISLIVRRSDLDREGFAKHYDENHAPLAMRVLPARLAGYRRNHVVWPAEAPFDCVSEFVFPDAAAMQEIFEYLASEDSRMIHEDEERFMDRARNAFYVVEEEVLRPRSNAGPTAIGVWVLAEGDAVDRAAATVCVHNHVQAPSREDAPPWRVLTELWYPDRPSWEQDRATWRPEQDGLQIVRTREIVTVRRDAAASA